MAEEDKKLEITESALIVGLFNLLGAIAERMFGETPSITIKLNERGDTFSFVPSTYLVKWSEQYHRQTEAQPSEVPTDSAKSD